MDRPVPIYGIADLQSGNWRHAFSILQDSEGEGAEPEETEARCLAPGGRPFRWGLAKFVAMVLLASLQYQGVPNKFGRPLGSQAIAGEDPAALAMEEIKHKAKPKFRYGYPSKW